VGHGARLLVNLLDLNKEVGPINAPTPTAQASSASRHKEHHTKALQILHGYLFLKN
jgi:hypothetical protein